MAEVTKKHDITLYTSKTPNGWKISVALEEMGVPYNMKYVHLSKEEQKTEWFTKINPNSRIPAIGLFFFDISFLLFVVIVVVVCLFCCLLLPPLLFGCLIVSLLGFFVCLFVCEFV